MHPHSLEDLTARVAPPAEPTAIDWDAAEQSLGDGFRFPEDYRALAERYGPGIFGGAIKLYIPNAPVAHFDVRAESVLQAEINRERLAAPHVGPPWRYPLYPEPGGLVTWGEGIDANPLYWAPRGAPEAWPTVIEDYEDLSMHEFAMPTATMLLALLEERLDVPFFTYIPPEERYTFEPLSMICDTGGSSSPLLDAVLWPARTTSRGVRHLLRRSRDLLGG